MIVWTVSMKRAELDPAAAMLLADYEHELVSTRGSEEVDMSEEEFFSFQDACAAEGLTLPVDGSNSWAKHV